MDKLIEQKVTLAKNKDNEALGFLYEQFYKDVYYTCFKFLNNEELAKDMAQDTFIKAFEKIEDLADGTKFKSWICQIANRLCLNYIKRSKIIEFEDIAEAEEVMESSTDTENNPEDITVDNEIANILLKAIEKLPYDQRICVFMFYYENMSVKEIASQVECSENTVRGKLRYASNNLQKYIENLGDEGLKLRCIGILPFLYIVYNKERAGIAVSATAKGLAGVMQTVGGVSAAGATVAGTATAGAMVEAAAVGGATVAGGTAVVAVKTGILTSVLIGTGVAAAVAAVATAVVIGVSGSGKDVDEIASTSPTVINQEAQSEVESSEGNAIGEDTTEEMTESVALDENTFELNHYNINDVFEMAVWGKYVFYHDQTEQKSIIMNIETGDVVKEVKDKGFRYIDYGDAVIIFWSDGEYKDICIVDKEGKYIHEDIMYIGDESNDYPYILREYSIDDFVISDDLDFVYLSYNEGEYLLKSFSLSEGIINYETKVNKSIIGLKNEYYAVYYDIDSMETVIVNIETGLPVAKYSKDEVALINVRLFGEHYSILQYENMYLTNYRRFNIDGEEDINVSFSVDDKVSTVLRMGVEVAHGLDYLFLEREKDGVKESALYKSDMTPIVEFSSEYASYFPLENRDYAGVYSGAYAIYDMSYIGKVFVDGGKNIIEASQMVNILSDMEIIIALNNESTKKVINMKNGCVFEVSSSAEVYKIGHKSANEYCFAVIDGDNTDMYDEEGNYIFTTSVPVYTSWRSTQSMWHMKDSSFYVYNDKDGKESKVYIYDASNNTEVEIATEKAVLYSFMVDEKNIIYSTKLKAGQYGYILKNIETNEEKELFVSEYEVLYDCNKYGFVIGEESNDVMNISNISCDIVTY